MAHPKTLETPFSTIVFDLDGTLVDTEPAAAQAIRECFQGWGLTVDPSDSAYITGRTWAMAFDHLFKKYPIPVPAEQAAEEMMERYRKSLLTHLKFVPGSADAVKALAGHFKLALVSGSNRSEIFFALDRLGVREQFEVVLGAEDYPKSKPAPDGYLKAMKMLQANAAETLIFEDSEAGIASARAAGTWVVAITGTNHFNQDISKAHEKIPDLTQVNAEWVKALAVRLPGFGAVPGAR